METSLLRSQAAHCQKLEKQMEQQTFTITSQRNEIEDLRRKLAKVDVNSSLIPPQQLNVKSYLAGVETNLSALQKENEALEEEIQKQNSPAVDK